MPHPNIDPNSVRLGCIMSEDPLDDYIYAIHPQSLAFSYKDYDNIGMKS